MIERLRIIRDTMVGETWKQYKREITMEDLAEIFKVETVTAYKVLKKQYVQLKSRKGTR